MTDYSGALNDLGSALSGAPAVPQQQTAPPNDFSAALADIANAKPPPPPPPDVPAYTGSILPMSIDKEGHWSPAVPTGIKALYSAAVSGARAPGDVYTGRAATPFSAPRVPASPSAISANPDPALLGRGADFGLMFGTVPSAALRAGEMIPGEIAATRGAPSAKELKAEGSAGYDALRKTGLEIDPAAVSQMATGLQNDLTRRGFGATVAPATHSIISDIANPGTLAPGQNRVATIDDILGIRQNLGNVSGTSQEATAGNIAKHAVDDFLSELDPKAVVGGTTSPQDAAKALAEANANYAAAQRSNTLTGALDRGNTGIESQATARAHAANSGLNLDNAIRQRVASLLQKEDNLAGFSNLEVAALNNVVEGGGVQNAARRLGNLMGGGQGMHGGAMGTLGAIIGAHAGGGMEGAGAGAAIPILAGAGAKGLENYLSRRSLNNVDEMVRARSPLADALAGMSGPPAMNRNSAVLRSVLPGLLSPQPASRPSTLAQILAGA